MAYASANGDLGDDLKGLFKRREHGHNTRSAHLFVRPDVPTDRGQRAFSFVGPKLLNNVDDVVGMGLAKKQFRKCVRDRIVGNRGNDL
jgi:hypothetical protein